MSSAEVAAPGYATCRAGVGPAVHCVPGACDEQPQPQAEDESERDAGAERAQSVERR
jgi:hypothetical protein